MATLSEVATPGRKFDIMTGARFSPLPVCGTGRLPAHQKCRQQLERGVLRYQSSGMAASMPGSTRVPALLRIPASIA